MTCGTCKYETASDFPCSGCTHGRWWEPKDDEQQVQAESISPEPVAWMYKSEPWFDGNRWHDKYDVTTDERVARFKDKNPQPLYTTPPERKPLTDDQRRALIKTSGMIEYVVEALELIRAVEAAHGIGEQE